MEAVRDKINENSEKTCEFIETINKATSPLSIPVTPKEVLDQNSLGPFSISSCATVPAANTGAVLAENECEDTLKVPVLQNLVKWIDELDNMQKPAYYQTMAADKDNAGKLLPEGTTEKSPQKSRNTAPEKLVSRDLITS